HNPFFSYQLPMAIIKFKQGFGRLIRNKSDSGMVVVLDSRIVQKRYGRQFIAAIPKCHIEVIAEERFE
ncbi:MAG: helicase C-terminal domain-containing protein, partial [Planctomycetota bacterium]